MRRFSGICAYEGEETTDRRFITPGALAWPDEGVPLRLGFDGPIIGKVEKLKRDGNAIRCEGFIPEDPSIPSHDFHAKPSDDDFGFGLAVGVVIHDAYTDEKLGGLVSVLASGTIYAVSVATGEPAFPSARLEWRTEAEGAR